jgi:hypothetical protein
MFEIITVRKNVRWTYGNQKPRNPIDITPMDIVVFKVNGNNPHIRWFPSPYFPNYVIQALENGEKTYPVPDKWGTEINENNLPFWEEEFIKTMGRYTLPSLTR